VFFAQFAHATYSWKCSGLGDGTLKECQDAFD
jgi:hypothetical protein